MRTKQTVVILLLILFSVACGKREVQEVTKLNYRLDECSWEYREVGTEIWKTAKVPGCVHTDLLRNGEIEDPFYRDNETRLQWIGERDWEYKTEFILTEKFLKKENCEITFEGLDTYAKVYLNNQLILSSDNMFRTYVLDCKKYLKAGNNNLLIKFDSAVKIDKEKAAKLPYKMIDSYVHTRKAAYHYGWDWGPVYITSGIWKPLYINAWNEAKINNIEIKQENVSEDKADLTFILEVETSSSTTAEINLYSEKADYDFDKQIKLNKGINTIPINLTLNNPNLWWSTGLGEAFLYDFTAELIIKDEVKDRVKENFGIRTVKVIQKPDSLGKSFYVELNGVPVFMKGANYIPQDMFLNRPTDADYENVIKQAVAANMNMLRVWGGGIYEKDIFYNLCDKYGVLVWQDFMYACSMYPGDEQFLETAKQEAIDNVKRLRNHPSIALWCGNNENYIGWKDWRWPKRYSKEDSAKIWNDYDKLFHQILPEVVSEYDSDKFYWPSSPLHGWGYPVNTEGDVHYWGIWHAQEPFEEFQKPENIGRFMSEYGFQSCPEFNTVKEFTVEKDWDINSPVMKNHQKHHVGYPVIDKYIKWYYKWPKDFQAYLYVSQLVQAKGIGLAIKTHRNAMPHCMGTLYWQLNDCWPVASWSSIDSYNRWKALHYRTKELYDDIIIVTEKDKENVKVNIVSDKLKNTKAQLRIKLLGLDGTIHWYTEKEVDVKANTSAEYFEISKEELLQDAEENNCVLVSELNIDNKKMTSECFYFVQPKDLKLTEANIGINSEKCFGGYSFEISSDKLTKNIFLSFESIKGSFSNNYFDILPGEKITVKFETEENIKNIKDKLIVYSLIDSFED